MDPTNRQGNIPTYTTKPGGIPPRNIPGIRREMPVDKTRHLAEEHFSTYPQATSPSRSDNIPTMLTRPPITTTTTPVIGSLAPQTPQNMGRMRQGEILNYSPYPGRHGQPAYSVYPKARSYGTDTVNETSVQILKRPTPPSSNSLGLIGQTTNSTIVRSPESKR